MTQIITVLVFARSSGDTRVTMATGTLEAFAQVLSLCRAGANGSALILVAELGCDLTQQDVLEQATLLVSKLPSPGIYVTAAAQDLLRTATNEEVRFEDFGVFQPSAGTRAERLYAVLHPDLPLPTRAEAPRTGNCPRLQRSFVGRAPEIEALTNLVKERRIVSITGPPGIGKTALALRIARALDEYYPDGVWWFALDDCNSADGFAARVGGETQLAGLMGRTDLKSVARRVASKSALLILDGGDSLLPELTEFCQELQRSGGSIGVMLTLQKRLEIPGEFSRQLEPLSTRFQGPSLSEFALLEADALALLYERAEEAGVLLALDAEALTESLALCVAVDGIPLAIELIAVALRQMRPKTLLRKLAGDRPSTVMSGGAMAQLAAAITSACSRVPAQEQLLFRRLGYFEGSWSIEAAAALTAYEPIESPDFYRLHASLVNRSLISCNPDSGTFRLLRPIRAAINTRGAESEYEAFAERLLVLLRQWSGCVYSSEGRQAEVSLERHYADCLSALVWAGEQAERHPLASAFLQNIVPYWSRRNLLGDAHLYCSKLLPLAKGIDRVRILMMLGIVAWRRKQLPEAGELFRLAALQSDATGYQIGHAAACTNLAMTLSQASRHTEALESHQEALALFASSGDIRRLANGLCNAAQGALAAAESREEDRERCLELAVKWLEEFSALDVEDPALVQAFHHNSGRLATLRGDLEWATLQYRKAIYVCHEHGLKHEAFEALLALSRISLLIGQPQQAAQYLGLARAILHGAGHAPTDEELEATGLVTRGLHTQLGQARSETLMAYGARLDLLEISGLSALH